MLDFTTTAKKKIFGFLPFFWKRRYSHPDVLINIPVYMQLCTRGLTFPNTLFSTSNMEKWNDFASLHQNKTFPAVIWPDKHGLSLSALLFFAQIQKPVDIQVFQDDESRCVSHIQTGFFLLFKSKATQTPLFDLSSVVQGIKSTQKNDFL